MARWDPRLDLLPAFLIFFPFVLGAVFFGFMPEKMATHWSADGAPDGYLPKLYGVFLLPVISAGIYFLLVFLPKIDPLKKNIDAFKPRYMEFVTLLLGFLLYVYLLTIVANLGYSINIFIFLIPALSVLFYFLASLLEHSRRNFFIGIRTPWTLSSDAVWQKTNRLGGTLFRIYSVFLLLSLVFQDLWLWIVVVPLFAIGGFLIYHSYHEYARARKTY